MKSDLIINHGVIIPFHELEIITSRSGGAGGQHVNKTNTKVTIRWSLNQTTALTDSQKELIKDKIPHAITDEGFIIIHNSESRSQDHNRKAALNRFIQLIKQALHVPKRRIPTNIPTGIQEKRLKEKSRRSKIKKMRSRKIDVE